MVCTTLEYPLLSSHSAVTTLESRNSSTTTPDSSRIDKKVAFAALQHSGFGWFFVTTMLAMMADNIEHVISYWVLFQKFQSPVLAGFAVISHWTPFLLLSVYLDRKSTRLNSSHGYIS